MPYYCTVPRCTSMAGKVKNVSFHQFPRDEELAKLWNQVLKRGKPYTKYSKVCSLHFKPEDYTMTSAQKNRGQWRTLRKDAVPSQNLPSESPADEWHRRNTNSFQSTMNIDSSVQHQMAQAIYVQTMLAMQVAGIGDAGINSVSSDQPSPSNSDITDIDNTDTNPIATHTDGPINNASEKVTFECNQCSKCFKDPDVFILHQRNHVKTENNTEMLKANPILANLLKSDTENVNKNVISIENQIMSALTENMANYLRNLTTIMTNGNTSNYATDKSDSADDFEGIDNSNNIEYRNVKMEEEDSDYSSKLDTNALEELDRFKDNKLDSDSKNSVIANGSIKREIIDNNGLENNYINDIVNTSIKNNMMNVNCGLNSAEISQGFKEEYYNTIDRDNIIETIAKTIINQNVGNNSTVDDRNVKSYSDRKPEIQSKDKYIENISNSSIDYKSVGCFKNPTVNHRPDSINGIDSRNDDTQTVI